MMIQMLHDRNVGLARAAADMFRADVIEGLSADPKWLPSKYFYDHRGSQLFDQICSLEEYYLTRCELEIMARHANEMGPWIGEQAMLIELGSGSSVKTRLLLDHANNLAAYVPVDISEHHLKISACRLANEFTFVEVLPVAGDFTEPLALPRTSGQISRRVVYFPGSTIGNFERRDAIKLLRHIATIGGMGGGLLIGIDLEKDSTTITAAYNDADGVTAEFNRNILHRINRELTADFRVEQFQHSAIYDRANGRIEMQLVSAREQSVQLDDRAFHFAPGEAIRTEYSHKYKIREFARLAADCGLALRKFWTDRRRYFAVLYLEVQSVPN